MSFKPAFCPKCDDLILVSEKTPFVECPACDGAIAAEEAITKLEDHCRRPSNIQPMLSRCIEMEAEFGSELPTAILAILADSFPGNEQVHYLVTKMGGYQPQLVESYLVRFSKDRKKTPFAEDFLTEAMTVRNMEHMDLFEDYINNKVKSDRKAKYIELLRTLKQSYQKVADSSPSLTLLFSFFWISTIINVAFVFWFLFTRMPFWAHVLIVFGVLAVQMGILYLHNKTFGNRIKISDRERLFMVIYMSSAVIAIGAVFIGSLFSI